MTPEEFLDGSPLGMDVYRAVHEILERCGEFEVRTTRSQIAFRRRRGFAYLWRPGMYLSRPDAEIVLSLALDHAEDSPRWKEVVQPTRSLWQHHLEVHDASEIDGEVAAWVHDAYNAAG